VPIGRTLPSIDGAVAFIRDRNLNVAVVDFD